MYFTMLYYTLMCFFMFMLLSVSVVPLIKLILSHQGFITVQLKMYHPFCIKGILLHRKSPLWGIQDFIIYVPHVSISFPITKLKLLITISKMQVFLTRNLLPLTAVNLIEGNQEPNILMNFLYKILPQRLRKKTTPVESKSNGKDSEKGKLRLFVQGIVHFLVVMLLHVIQIQFENVDFSITSGIVPEEKISFSNYQERIQTLMLLQSLSEYILNIPLLKISVGILNYYQEKILLQCEQLVILSRTHMNEQEPFCQATQLHFELIIPFSMSLAQSFQQITFFIRIRNAYFRTMPQDFDHFFQFIRQCIFDPFKFDRQQTQQQLQEQAQEIVAIEQHKDKSSADLTKDNPIFPVNLQIETIVVELSNISEADYDNEEAYSHLKNINKATLALQSINLSERKFQVESSNLIIEKFMVTSLKNERVQVLKIPGLQIHFNNEGRVQIQHSEVNIFCEGEEIALLGKLFTIINNRLKFQQYDQLIYQDLFQAYHQNNSIQEIIHSYLHPQNKPRKPSIHIPSNQNEQLPSLLEKTVIYKPKALIFELQLKNLTHKITLNSFEYIQHETLREINHELIIHKATIEYKNIKQFAISNFRLIFSQKINLNQLTLFIEDITMNQNQETLIEYLDNFTLLKYLLQMEGANVSEEQKSRKQQMKMVQKSGRMSRKLISINQISMSLNNELVILRKLQIDKETLDENVLNYLYFSLSKCEIMLNKMKYSSAKYKYAMNHSHCLFSVESITVKTTLYCRNEKEKEGSMIHIKDPTFTLPESDISARIVSYLQAYSHLQSHVSAFFLNITDQNFQKIKVQHKSFLIEPDSTLIKITNLNFLMADNFFDQKILAFSKTIREYLFDVDKFNEIEVLNQLRRNNKIKNDLLSLKIQLISIDISPIMSLRGDEQTIQEWISDFQSMSAVRQTVVVKDLQQSRKDFNKIKRVQTCKLKINFKHITLQIRDYPFNIFQSNFLEVKAEYLMKKYINAGEEKIVKGNIQIGKVEINAGLGQLSGFNEVHKRLNHHLQQINKFKENQEFFKSKDPFRAKCNGTFWNQLYANTKWNFKLEKDTNTIVNLLTDCTPYGKDCFSIEIGKFMGISEPSTTSFQTQGILIDFKDFRILKLSSFQFLILANFSNNSFLINIEILSSEQCFVMINNEIVNYVVSMKQLKKDWLLIYNLFQVKQKLLEDLSDSTDLDQLSYFDVVKIIAEKNLNSQQKRQSVLSYIKQFKCELKVEKFYFLVNAEQYGIHFITHKFRVFTIIKPDQEIYQRWKVIKTLITCEYLIGKMVKLKLKNHMNSTRLIEEDQKKRHQLLNSFIYYQKNLENDEIFDKEINKRIFIVCNKISLKFNWFHQESLQVPSIITKKVQPKQNKVYFVNQYIQVQSLKAEVSKEIKIIIEKMVQTFLTTKIKKIDFLTEKNKFYKKKITSREKLRRCVMRVIRINRRNKLSERKIEKINLLVKVKVIELALKTDKRMIILSSNEKGHPSVLKQFLQYSEGDQYHSDPISKVNFKMERIRMNIMEFAQSEWIIEKIFTQIYPNQILSAEFFQFHLQKHPQPKRSPYYYQNAHKQQDKAYCIFSQGEISLQEKTKNMLQQIIEFTIDLVQTREFKRKLYREETEKYSELINIGREKLLKKIEWNQSDLKKQEQMQFHCQFSLKDMKIQIKSVKENNNQEQPLLTIISKETLIILNTFSHDKIDKEIIVYDLSVVNEMEEEGSLYRNLLEMAVENKSNEAEKGHYIKKIQKVDGSEGLSHSELKAVIRVVASTYEVRAFSDVPWDYFQNLRIYFNPIKVKLTEELKDELIRFLIGETEVARTSKEGQYDELQYYQSQLPSYIKKMVFSSINLQTWYRSPSILKRMEGIHVKIDQYALDQKFYTKKEFLDAWIMFIAKQFAHQIFNVIGQKLFG